MYRGRQMLGTEISLGVLCINGSLVPSAPTAAPTVDIYSASEKILAGISMPPMDRYRTTGYFQHKIFLDGRFSAGQYRAVYRYTVGSYNAVVVDFFEVVAGGNVAGTPIAMYFYRRPHCDWVVQQADSGRIFKRRNPNL